jgi:hypothetical protein
MKLSKNRKELLFVFFLLLLTSCFFHLNKINEFPLYTHAWAQADRYAIALGFLDNQFNLFYPQTFVLNTQFPGDFLVAGNSGITSVDFPIHEIIVAGFMKLFHTQEPWIFRIYELLISVIGFLYLFRISRLFNINFLGSIFITLFAALSPVWVYYQAGFIPGITSISFSIIGLYYYFSCRINVSTKLLPVAFIFLTIAAASRTTFIIPLLTISGIEVLQFIQKKKFEFKSATLIIGSFIFIASYYFWNVHLRNLHGSLFLNELKPANSITEFIEILENVQSRWLLQYMSIMQYCVLAGLIILFIILSIKKNQTSNSSVSYLKLFLLIDFWGCVCFFFAMMQQFSNHDYYFIDTFYLPIFLLLIALFSRVQNAIQKIPMYIQISTLIICVSLMMEESYATQIDKRITGQWDKTASLVYDYDKLDKKLDSIGISRNAKILVLDAVAPNIPFIQMKRKGFVVVTTSKENLQNAIHFPFNYIAIQDNWFMNDIYPNYPEIIDLLNKKADLGAVSIYTLRDTSIQTSLFDFLELNKKTSVIHEECTFESTLKSEWEHTEKSDSVVLEGQFSGIVLAKNEYGLTFRTKPSTLFTYIDRTLFLSADVFKPELSPKCKIVVSIDAPGKNLFFQEIPLTMLSSIKSSWKKTQALINIPKTSIPNSTLTVYFWNKGRNYLHIDNMEIYVN